MQHSEVLPSPQNEEHSQNSENTENSNQKLKLKTNDVTDFMNEHCTARIIGPAGESTGKYKTCKNIEYEAPEALAGAKAWIDIPTLQNLSVNKPIPAKE